MKKDNLIRFRVTKTERELIETASAKIDETLSEFVKIPAILKAKKILKTNNK